MPMRRNSTTQLAGAKVDGKLLSMIKISGFKLTSLNYLRSGSFRLMLLKSPLMNGLQSTKLNTLKTELIGSGIITDKNFPAIKDGTESTFTFQINTGGWEPYLLDCTQPNGIMLFHGPLISLVLLISMKTILV